MTLVNKVIIVEGKSDKKRVQQVIAEPVHIICTHGTMSIDKIDDMIESLYGKQVFILADSDDEGANIRKWFKRYLKYLAKVLHKHGFMVRQEQQLMPHLNMERFVLAND